LELESLQDVKAKMNAINKRDFFICYGFVLSISINLSFENALNSSKN